VSPEKNQARSWLLAGLDANMYVLVVKNVKALMMALVAKVMPVHI
jgi:hypothetical protein